MKKSLDAIDLALLQALREDARIPLSTLAAQVHLSRNAVRQRIERLERDAHIQGYTIVEKSDDATTVGAYMLVQRVDRLRGNDVIHTLQSVPEVKRCDVVSGEFDLIVHIESDSASRVQEIWQEIADHPGVRDTTTALTLSTKIRR